MDFSTSVANPAADTIHQIAHPSLNGSNQKSLFEFFCFFLAAIELCGAFVVFEALPNNVLCGTESIDVRLIGISLPHHPLALRWHSHAQYAPNDAITLYFTSFPNGTSEMLLRFPEFSCIDLVEATGGSPLFGYLQYSLDNATWEGWTKSV